MKEEVTVERCSAHENIGFSAAATAEGGLGAKKTEQETPLMLWLIINVDSPLSNTNLVHIVL